MESRRGIFIAGIVILGLFLIGVWYQTLTKCKGLACVTFDGKENYKVKTIFEENKKAYRAVWSTGKTQLRIEKYLNISEDEAASFNEYKSMQIASLYEDAKSPYPGVLSDRISCEGKYKPIFKKISDDSLNKETYSGYLNARMQFGSCIQDQLVYESNAAIFYCKSQKAWYQLEFISPINQKPSNIQHTIQSIRCLD